MATFKKVFNWSLCILVLFVLTVEVSLILSYEAEILDHEIVLIGIAAFFGAFFVFVFDRFSKRLSAFRKGNNEHFNALVKIERLLNRTMAQLDKNAKLGRDDINALNSMKILVWNLPPIPFSHELADNLKNIDFVNDYFDFMMGIESLNHDLNVMMTAYNEVKSMSLGKTISPEHYKDNVIFIIKQVSEIIKFMESYQAETTELLAKARILLKEREHRIFLLGAWPRRYYDKNIGQQQHEELLALKSEIELTKKKSREEINKTKRATT